MSCISIDFIMTNLFLAELMFKWPMMTYLGWYERKRFKTNLILPSWIVELLFIIKKLEFDELIMFLLLWSLLQFVSLLEFTYQNIRMLNKIFPASIIVPFKCKCRPFMGKWDAELL